MCTRCFPATQRIPRERVQPGAETSTPIRINWCTARGVSPSPHTFSRGKRAFSRRITSTPARARWYAAEEPAGPAPTTITWASSPVRGTSRGSASVCVSVFVSVVPGVVGSSRMTSLSSDGRCTCRGTGAPADIIDQYGPGRYRARENPGRPREPAAYAPLVTTPPDAALHAALDRADAALLARLSATRACPSDLLGRMVRHPAPGYATSASPSSPNAWTSPAVGRATPRGPGAANPGPGAGPRRIASPDRSTG